ncbi:Hpt domain-containing protein [Sphingomonas sp.]|uniref:Hpt domain-containing protein n=1 Tax=Sphingomonas sp. TaxID=28214 RepID=UPI003CC51E7E
MILGALPMIETLLGRDQRDTLLRMGVAAGERSGAVLQEALAAGDVARAKQEAHSLRGAAGPFGAEELGALLRRIETGEAVSAAAVAAGVDAFVAACRAALTGMSD